MKSVKTSSDFVVAVSYMTSTVILYFSYAAAFWLWPQWEEQTQVHGPVRASTSWHDWHGGSGECVFFLKSIFTISMFFSRSKKLLWTEIVLGSVIQQTRGSTQEVTVRKEAVDRQLPAWMRGCVSVRRTAIKKHDEHSLAVTVCVVSESSLPSLANIHTVNRH